MQDVLSSLFRWLASPRRLILLALLCWPVVIVLLALGSWAHISPQTSYFFTVPVWMIGMIFIFLSAHVHHRPFIRHYAFLLVAMFIWLACGEACIKGYRLWVDWLSK
jgi:hypothetical protein